MFSYIFSQIFLIFLKIVLIKKSEIFEKSYMWEYWKILREIIFHQEYFF